MTNSGEISVTQQHKSIENASRSKNPIEEASVDYSKYEQGDFRVSLYCKHKADVSPRIVKWAFQLAEKNVGPFYKTCKLGWQPKMKQAELNKNWARYLVAVNSNKEPVAYAMFRFDLDYGTSVLYCYEMHVEKSSQRNGLGRFMMSALEKTAHHFGLEKIVLTVLKNNPDGKAFFTNIGYSDDETSPDSSDGEDYEILSKKCT